MGGVGGILGLHMKNEDGVLQSTLENSRCSIADNSTWAQVNGNKVSTTLGHQIPLPWWHWGGDGWGTSDKTSADQQADDMSCWATVVPLLTARCLYWDGVGGRWGIGGYMKNERRMKMVYCKVLLKTEDSLLNTADNRIWDQVNGTQISTTLGHQMPLSGAWRGIGGGPSDQTKHQPDPQADQMSCWPAVVPLLTTRCLYWGWVGCQGANEGLGGCQGHQGWHLKIKMVYCKVLLKTQDSIEYCRQ